GENVGSNGLSRASGVAPDGTSPDGRERSDPDQASGPDPGTVRDRPSAGRPRVPSHAGLRWRTRTGPPGPATPPPTGWTSVAPRHHAKLRECSPLPANPVVPRRCLPTPLRNY